MAQEFESPLARSLWRLALSVRERVRRAKDAGQIVEVATTYLRTHVTHFNYGDRGGISLSKSFQYVQKPEWHWRQQHAFVQETIKDSEEFKACISLVSKEATAQPGQGDFWLSRFVQILVSRATKELTDEDLIELLTTFIGDVHEAPMNVQIVGWLDGLWLGPEAIEVEHGILRRPEPKDLETERSLELVPYSSSNSEMMFGPPPAVVALNVQAKSVGQAQEILAALMNCLLLFRLGSVRSTQYTMQPNSLVRSGGTIFGGNNFQVSHYKYKLDKSDESELKAFIGRMRPLVSTESSSLTATGAPIHIAFRRYTDAVLGLMGPQERLTSGITCLEALFLKSKERSELSYRLSQRVAALMKMLGFHPLPVQNEVQMAYEIRSTFIHGGTLENDKLQPAEELCETILNYARMSLLIFLQVVPRLEKEELINRLDDGLLELKRFSKLEGILSELKIPH